MNGAYCGLLVEGVHCPLRNDVSVVVLLLLPVLLLLCQSVVQFGTSARVCMRVCPSADSVQHARVQCVAVSVAEALQYHLLHYNYHVSALVEEDKQQHR